MSTNRLTAIERWHLLMATGHLRLHRRRRCARCGARLNDHDGALCLACQDRKPEERS